MIHATVRHRLTRDDAQLVARLIARDSGAPLEEIERRLADEGIDSVLDDPLLPTAMLRAGQGMWTSLPLFSYVMVRHALRRVGEEDRRLADYARRLIELSKTMEAEVARFRPVLPRRAAADSG